MEESVDSVGFGKFREVHVSSVAFPSTEELDLLAGQACRSSGDRSTFPKGMAGESPGGDARLEEKAMDCLDKEVSREWTTVAPGKERVIGRTRDEGVEVFKSSDRAEWRGNRGKGDLEADVVWVSFG